jgi:Tfp pilus assembly protein PilN
VIAGLDRARKGPVRIMDELATHVPERLWLDSVITKGPQIELTGQSLDNELVAVFLGALGDSPYFTNVDLNSTELGDGRDGLKVVKFKIQATMAGMQTEEAAPKGKGGKAPAKGPAKKGKPRAAGAE